MTAPIIFLVACSRRKTKDEDGRSGGGVTGVAVEDETGAAAVRGAYEVVVAEEVAEAFVEGQRRHVQSNRRRHDA